LVRTARACQPHYHNNDVAYSTPRKIFHHQQHHNHRGYCSQAKIYGWEYAVCLIDEKSLFIQKLMVCSGLIPAASISQAVLNSRKPLTRCFNGIRMHKYAMLICPTFRIPKMITRERTLTFVIAHGGQ
jgi:hypothetical protein